MKENVKRICFTLICLAVLALIVVGCVYAEEPAIVPSAIPTSPAKLTYTIDLTQIVTLVIGAVLSFLTAWIAKTIVPPVRKWLAAHTTHEQRETLWKITTELVKAAEQLIKGPGRGTERLNYVVHELEKRGFTADIATIEAAVKDMNDFRLADIFLEPADEPAAEPTEE